MRNVRTNQRSRLLLYRDYEFTAIGFEFIFFNIFLGLLPLFLGGFFFAQCGLSAFRELQDPNTPLSRLQRPLTDQEKASGMVQLSGIIDGDSGAAPPLCNVIKQHKSGKSTYTDFEGSVGQNPRIVLPDGTTYPIQTELLGWEPLNRGDADHRESYWRTTLSLSSGGWLKDQCIERGQKVFLEGCLVNGVLEGCGLFSPAVITPGDGTAQPRINELASGLLARLSLLGAAALMLLLYGWRIFSARPLVQALARWVDEDPAYPRADKIALWLCGTFWLMALIGHWLLRWVSEDYALSGASATHVFAYIVLSAGMITLLITRHRRRLLNAAMRPVLAAPTIPLSSVQETGQLVELAVKVKKDAPLSKGPLSEQEHAWWSTTTDRVYKSGKNYACHRAHSDRSKNLVPIEDASGEGLLDLSGAEFDLRAYRLKVKGHRLHGTNLQPMALGAYSSGGDVFVFEESYLQPEETLYVFGVVVKQKPAETAVAYRESSSIPIIGGAQDKKLIVYAGTEGSLLQNIRRELRYLDLVFYSLVALNVALVGAVAWLSWM